MAEKIKKMLHDRPLIFQNDPSYHLATLRKAPMMASTIYEIKKALDHGIDPQKITLASSTVYLMKDCESRSLAIFKMGWHPDHDARNEIAAYLLDHQNFAMVPPVVSADFNHTIFGGRKRGSCHLYMGDDYEPFFLCHKTRAKLTASSLRKIAALDIRLLNGDRHFGNFIVSKDNAFPIDHALILPYYREHIHVYFDWLNWDQAKTPFSEEEKKYIQSIDVQKDAKMLMEELRYPDGVAAMYIASTILLQVGVQKGLNAYQIGKLIVNENKESLSAFSQAIKNIGWDGSTDWDLYSKKVQKEMEICVLSM